MKPESSVAQTLATIRAARESLRQTFPRVDHAKLIRICADHGLERYPDALMLRQPGNVAPAAPPTRWRRPAPAPSKTPSKARPAMLFSESYYRLANADLREVHVPVVLHWQLHGRLEGRSPHPFLDVAWLSQQAPDVLTADLVDVYLSDPRMWMLSPSPYVEAESFMLAGPWDGISHPLLQILRDYPVEPWLRGRLGVIDLATGDDELRAAIGALTARSPGLAKLSSFSMLTRQDVPGVPGGPATLRVIPGFALATGVQLVWSRVSDVMSGDGTALQISDGIVVLDTRDEMTCDRLLFVTSDADDATLDSLAREADGDALIAPFSPAQQTALEGRGVAVLGHSRQMTVHAGTVKLVGRPE